jgi:6,7-dimethyl-8-ribityllumazine synthase
MSQHPFQREAAAASSTIAFIQSCWHRDIVDQARMSFLRRMEQEGFAAEAVECFEVPGAFEIPLRAQLLAKSGRYDAIVAAGLVVDGGIYRHDFVAASVIDALMRVQLDTEVPVLSLVLTPQQFHEHETHRVFFRDHFIIKGEEAALACAATLGATRRLKESRVDVREARPAEARPAEARPALSRN